MSEPTDKNALSSVPAAGMLTKAAFDALPDEQKKALALKGFELQLERHDAAERSEQKYQDSSRELGDFVSLISEAERRTKGDVKGRVEVQGASGRTTIETNRNSYQIVLIIAIAVSVLAFLFLNR